MQAPIGCMLASKGAHVLASDLPRDMKTRDVILRSVFEGLDTAPLRVAAE